MARPSLRRLALLAALVVTGAWATVGDGDTDLMATPPTRSVGGRHGVNAPTKSSSPWHLSAERLNSIRRALFGKSQPQRTDHTSELPSDTEDHEEDSEGEDAVDEAMRALDEEAAPQPAFDGDADMGESEPQPMEKEGRAAPSAPQHAIASEEAPREEKNKGSKQSGSKMGHWYPAIGWRRKPREGGRLVPEGRDGTYTRGNDLRGVDARVVQHPDHGPQTAPRRAASKRVLPKKKHETASAPRRAGVSRPWFKKWRRVSGHMKRRADGWGARKGGRLVRDDKYIGQALAEIRDPEASGPKACDPTAQTGAGRADGHARASTREIGRVEPSEEASAPVDSSGNCVSK